MPAIVTILVTFHVNPGHKEEFLQRLGDLVDVMSKEDTFLNSFVTESAEDPNVLYNYETWAETQESFMATQFTKAYRMPYEAEVPRLLAHRESPGCPRRSSAARPTTRDVGREPWRPTPDA